MSRLLLLAAMAGCLFVAVARSADVDSKAGWPQWRGPNRDAISSEKGLLQSWPKEGPPLAWQTKGLGGGRASVVIAGGKLFTMGQRDGQDSLICLDARDGKELWVSPVGKTSNEVPASTPTIDGDRIYALGSLGDLRCFKTDTGSELWHASYTSDFGGRIPGWKYCESPLVDGDLVIGTPGGSKATLVAFHKTTGKVEWTCLVPEGGPGDGKGGYSSPVISEGAGVRQYVQLTGRGVVGVRASDGKFLWKNTSIINRTANIPTPIVVDDYVIASTGYDGGGTVLLKLAKDGDGVKAEEVYAKRAGDLQNHHGGMIRIGDYLYLGHGHNNGFPTCVEWKTGKVMWGKMRGPGSGSASIVYADGQLYFHYENGVVALIGARPDKYEVNGSFTPPITHPRSWSHPVVFDGKLFIRDQDDLMVYDVKAK